MSYVPKASVLSFVIVHDRFTLLDELMSAVEIFAWSPAVVKAVKFPPAVTLAKLTVAGVYFVASPIGKA